MYLTLLITFNKKFTRFVIHTCGAPGKTPSKPSEAGQMAVSTITPLQNLKPVHLGVKGAYVDRALFVHIRERSTWPAYVDYAMRTSSVGSLATWGNKTTAIFCQANCRNQVSS